MRSEASLKLPPAPAQKHRSRNDVMVAAMYSAYRGGLSLSGIAKLYRGRYKRQTIYEFFKHRGYKLRSRQLKPGIIFNGRKYTPGKDGRYRDSQQRQKNRFLHHAIWESKKGPVPPGYVIHHRDGNFSNNKICNLELMTIAESIRRFSPGHNQSTPFEKLRDPDRSMRRKKAKVKYKRAIWE